MDVNNLLEHNQILAGGAMMSCVAMLWQHLQTLPTKIFNLIKGRLTYSLTITEGDLAYDWVTAYLRDNLPEKRHVTVKTDKTIKSDKIKYSYELLPSEGNHFGWYKSNPMWISKKGPNLNGAKKDDIDSLFKAMLRQSYEVSFLWFDMKLLLDFLTSCKEKYAPLNVEEEKKLLIYCNRSWGDYILIDRTKKRNNLSIITKDSKHLDLIDDVRAFFRSKRRYEELGIPYYRGYLLYGPPGNGKTSLIKAIASSIPYFRSINSVNLATLDNDSALINCFTSAPNDGLLVVEDIDCVFNGRENTVPDNKVTMSCLLNCLDGLYAKEGQVVILTTNHKEKLDPALLRQGRIDYEMFLDNASPCQIEAITRRFFPDWSEAKVKNLAKTFEANTSMAKVQEYLLSLNPNLFLSEEEGEEFEVKNHSILIPETTSRR